MNENKEHEFATAAAGMILVFIAVGAIALFFIEERIFLCAHEPSKTLACEDHSPFILFIKEFQTLIGGALAVLAGFITVRQMRKSDERAARDFQRSFDLQNKERRDANLTLLTIIKHDLRNLIVTGNECIRQWEALKGRHRAENYTDIQSAVIELRKPIQCVDEMTSHDAWDHYAKYFSAEINGSIHTIKLAKDRLNNAIDELGPSFRMYPTTFEYENANFRVFLIYLKAIVEPAEIIQSQLERYELTD